jgi:hypothetical protein
MSEQTRTTAVNIPLRIASIFNETQRSRDNHVKNAVSLHKLQRAAVREQSDLSGEDNFTKEFCGNLARVLPRVKGDNSANLVMEFVGVFFKRIHQKGTQIRGQIID